MAVTVTFTGPLRDKTGGVKELEVEAASIQDLLRQLDERFGTDFGRMGRQARIVINGTAIQFLKGERTTLAAGDEISFLLPLAGG
jgi:molybdopterin converting factor small subunit